MPCQQQNRESTGRLQQRRKTHDKPAPETVGNNARHQHQQQRRQKLDNPDNAKIERIARQIINLPANGN